MPESSSSGAWAGSTRRARLPKDWPARVAATRERARGLCEAAVHHPACDGLGRECDHVKRGDDHELSNLQWLSVPCHKQKTKDERPRRQRPARAHPSDG